MNILLVDDHKVIRRVLADFLREELEATVFEGNNGIEGVNSFFGDTTFDLVIADINMPQMDGIEMVEKIRAQDKSVKIIALSMMDDSHSIKKMLKAGANGYVLKVGDTNELINAISNVMNDQSFYSPSVTETIMTSITTKRGEKSKHIEANLSNREKEVLRLIIDEYSNKEIGDKLFISIRTVETHKRHLLEKTGSKNVAGLLKYALRYQVFDDIEY